LSRSKRNCPGRYGGECCFVAFHFQFKISHAVPLRIR
jgi:hypothetical protein